MKSQLPKYLIGLLLLTMIVTSQASRWLLPNNGVFPFASWNLFSSFGGRIWPLFIEIHKTEGASEEVCLLQECSFVRHERRVFHEIWKIASHIQSTNASDKESVGQLEQKIQRLVGQNVRFRIFEYEVDVRTLDLNLAKRRLIYESPVKSFQ